MTSEVQELGLVALPLALFPSLPAPRLAAGPLLL